MYRALSGVKLDIIHLLHDLNYVPKRKGVTHGGEYCSPCPYCKEGSDRFIVWPNLSNTNGYKGGRFWCRVCFKVGDAITLLRDFKDLNYDQACDMLEINSGNRRIVERDYISIVAKNPPDRWVEKATMFVHWSHSQLLQSKYFLSVLFERGLSLETINAFKLGYNPKNLFRSYFDWGLEREFKSDGNPRRIWLPPGIVVPSFEGDKLVKIKIRNSNYEREVGIYQTMKEKGSTPKYIPSKYVVTKGSKKCPSIYGDMSLDNLLILESELDAILVIQETQNICFCLALGGSSQPLDLYKERIVRGAQTLLFCPDFDQAGKKMWDRWEKKFPDTVRVLTPYGKDPTEAFKYRVNLNGWIKEYITA